MKHVPEPAAFRDVTKDAPAGHAAQKTTATAKVRHTYNGSASGSRLRCSPACRQLAHAHPSQADLSQIDDAVPGAKRSMTAVQHVPQSQLLTDDSQIMVGHLSQHCSAQHHLQPFNQAARPRSILGNLHDEMSSLEAAADASSARRATKKLDTATAKPLQPHKLDSPGVPASSGGHSAACSGTQAGLCMQLLPQQAAAGMAPADAASAASPPDRLQAAVPLPHVIRERSSLEDGTAAMGGPELQPSTIPVEGSSSSSPQQLPSPHPAEQQVLITAVGPACDAQQRPSQELRTSPNPRREAAPRSQQQEWDEPCLTQLAAGGSGGAVHSLSQVDDPRPT